MSKRLIELGAKELPPSMLEKRMQSEIVNWKDEAVDYEHDAKKLLEEKVRNNLESTYAKTHMYAKIGKQ